MSSLEVSLSPVCLQIANVELIFMLKNLRCVGEKRRRELTRIRQIYVPELIIRLHSLLVSSRAFIPEYVNTVPHLGYSPNSWFPIRYLLLGT